METESKGTASRLVAMFRLNPEASFRLSDLWRRLRGTPPDWELPEDVKALLDWAMRDERLGPRVLEHARQLYEWEDARKERIVDYFNAPTGIITFIVAIIGIYLSKFPELSLDARGVAFIALAGGGVLALLLSIVHILDGRLLYSHGRAPTAGFVARHLANAARWFDDDAAWRNEKRAWIEEYRAWLAQQPSGSEEQSLGDATLKSAESELERLESTGDKVVKKADHVTRKLDDLLAGEFLRQAEWNALQNKLRLASLSRAMGYVVVSLVLLLLSYVPYSLIVRDAKDIQLIKIVADESGSTKSTSSKPVLHSQRGPVPKGSAQATLPLPTAAITPTPTTPPPASPSAKATSPATTPP